VGGPRLRARPGRRARPSSSATTASAGHQGGGRIASDPASPIGDFDRATDTVTTVRSSYLGAEGATKTRARERVVSLADAAQDVSTLCGLRDPREPLLAVAEDTLRDNFTKAQKALGIRHRSIYQAKHTFAVLSLLESEKPCPRRTQSRHLARNAREALCRCASEGPGDRYGNATENATGVFRRCNYPETKASPTGFARSCCLTSFVFA